MVEIFHLQKAVPYKYMLFTCQVSTLLEHLKSPTFNHVSSIKSFDFSTLYTTIPHQKLKDRLTSIIRNAFIFKWMYLSRKVEEKSMGTSWRDPGHLRTRLRKLTYIILHTSRCKGRKRGGNFECGASRFITKVGQLLKDIQDINILGSSPM